MRKYILVCHNFFVRSQGFRIEEIEVNNEDEAEYARLKMQDRMDRSHSHAAVVMIEIGLDETKGRSLSVGERLNGYLRPKTRTQHCKITAVKEE